MTDLTDKIADVIANCDMHRDSFRDIAYAIIAALPDMVAPLVWTKHPSRDIWRCDADFGTYKVYDIGPKPSWDFDSIAMQISFTADTKEAAITAANAHNAALVITAFTGVKP